MSDQQIIFTAYATVALSIVAMLRMFLGYANWVIWLVAVLWPLALAVLLLASIILSIFDNEF